MNAVFKKAMFRYGFISAVGSLTLIILMATVNFLPKESTHTYTVTFEKASSYTTDDFYDVPCDQVISGVLDCGQHDIYVAPTEGGSKNGIPLPVNKVVVVPDGQGHTFETGEYEVKGLAKAAEQNPDGTLTEAYYDRLYVQYCEAKPWTCE